MQKGKSPAAAGSCGKPAAGYKCQWLRTGGSLGASCLEFKFLPEKKVFVLGSLNVQAGWANTTHRSILLRLPEGLLCTRTA